MFFKVKRGEYIILFSGQVNFKLNQYINELKDIQPIIRSKNAYVASCLQNGTIIGYGRGRTTINIYHGKARIRKIRVIVLGSSKKSYPVFVNRNNGVPTDFIPEDLAKVEKGTLGWNMHKDIYICNKVALAYQEMQKSAAQDNIYMRVIHGYRSGKEQRDIINKLIEQKGKKEAERQAAPIGFSEHHTGLALDVGGMRKSDGTYITSNRDVYQWIEQNCHKFGFMIKNLKGKEHITGTKYEPWHIRYIGNLEITRLLYKKHLTLDEYLYGMTANHGNFDLIRDRHWNLKDICEICDIDITKAGPHINMEQNINAVKLTGMDIECGDIFFCDRQSLSNTYRHEQEKLAAEAVREGVIAIFSKWQLYHENGKKLPCIIVDNPMECIAKLGAYLRKQIPVMSIGITGTNGKSTTKYLLNNVLETTYKIHTDYANRNGTEDIYKQITSLHQGFDVYVQEISGHGPGAVKYGSQMVQPNACIITNIGNNHLGLYKTVDNLIADKLSILDNLREDGVAYLNMDDAVLSKVKTNKKMVYISQKNPSADYYIKDVEQVEDGIAVTFVDQYTNQDTAEYKVKVDIIGVHNAFNIVVAFALGQFSGLPEEDIIKGLSNYHSTGIRQVLKKVGGRYLYLDCFNVSETSIIASLQTLDSYPVSGKRYAIIGDSTWFQNAPVEVLDHIVASIQAFNINKIVCYQKNHRFFNRLTVAGVSNCVYIEEKAKLFNFLKQIECDDIILLKGSIHHPLVNFIDLSFGTDIYINLPYYRHGYATQIVCGNFRMRQFDEDKIISLERYSFVDQNVDIPDEFNGNLITHVNKSAFKGKSVEFVTLGKNILSICDQAFKDCVALQEVSFSPVLKYIGKSAFRNCIRLKTLILPQGLVHIDDYAFYNCNRLEEIYIPDSVSYIGQNAFKNCHHAEIKYEKNSYAEWYCKENIMRQDTPQLYENKVSIFCVGNIRVNYEMLMESKNAFQIIRYLLKHGDFSFGNLELFDYQSVEIKQIKAFVKRLYECGFGLMMGANESLGGDSENLVSMIKSIESTGISIIGTAKDSGKIFVKKIKNITFAILNYATFSDTKGGMMFQRYSLKQLQNDICKAKNAGAEFIIAYMHWGYRNADEKRLSDGQKQVAKELIGNGIDVIIGSHPANIQDIEMITTNHVTEKLCCYSLGDFLPDHYAKISNMGLVLNIILEKDENDAITPKFQYLPIRTHEQVMNFSHCIIPSNSCFTEGIQFKYYDADKKLATDQIGDLINMIEDTDKLLIC